MLLYLSGKIKKLDFISLAFVLTALFVSLTLIRNYFDTQISTLKTEVLLYSDALGSLKKRVANPRYPFATSYDRVNYHDYEFMKHEAMRKGPGEQGKPYVLKNPRDIEDNKKIYSEYGFYGVISDHISVNRSLPDVRHEKCKTKTYLRQLPKVSIIIVFYNEYFSMLKRTLHSIFNRTPHSLIHEIILVNDNSTSFELYEPLTKYVTENFGEIIKIRVLKERRGMIVGRLEGARFSTAEVVVFMDAHVEVNVNWLPPLLEPIALNPKVITTPIVDRFTHDTFEYKIIDDGGRGIFNWDMEYRRFPRRPEDKIYPENPISSPIMIGSAFAMNRRYFWDIGAYDSQLKVSQGEQFEMSFKAHLCGRGLLECPCSRIGHHSYRNQNYYKRFENGTDFAARNIKRIAEVWMDEYKEIVFNRHPSKYQSIDAGSLVREKNIRQGLHCKPFRYFMEFIANEMLERYPIVDQGYFVKGSIQSKSNPSLCVEMTEIFKSDDKTMEAEDGEKGKLMLSKCEDSRVNPSQKQSFTLTWHRNIQNSIYDHCIQNSLTIMECHFHGGNQLWKFDLDTSQIINPLINARKCLSINKDKQSLLMEDCDESDVNQKWNWGEKNLTALRSWDSFGVEITSLK